MKEFIGIFLMAMYFIIHLRFFPHGKSTLDVFKINPPLLPFWWKYFGIAIILLISVYSITEKNFTTTNTFLLTVVYFGLLQIVFSKEKSEDEFSAQIRLKAMYVSMISLFFLAGIFSSFEMIRPGAFSEDGFRFFMMLFNAVVIVYLSYFYLSKYAFKK